MRSIVVDSGFFIALFDETDALHVRCREFLKGFRGRFLTTEAVVAETLALLSVTRQLRCLDWLGNAVQARLLEVDREPFDFHGLKKLAGKYSALPMDFADATIVQFASRTGIRETLAGDRRDSSVYRLRSRVRFVDVLVERDVE